MWQNGSWPDIIDRSADQAPTLDLICRVCCDLLPITVASVVLMGDQGVEGITGASDALAAAVQNEEFTLGEGPATDVRRQRRPVLVSDLRDVTSDWPRFVPAVARLGIRAMYAIPLRIGAVDLGVLVSRRRRPRGHWPARSSPTRCFSEISSVGWSSICRQGSPRSRWRGRLTPPTPGRSCIKQPG